ncbi:HTH_48 domain-containing protein [Trichonephila clavipes]|nr:HTH_48 domain-containing protein [Trichonephila clavipes]
MERRGILNSWLNKEVRAIIHYEWARGVSVAEIYNRLIEVYGPDVMTKQMVRKRCRQFNDGCQQVQGIPRPGRVDTATTHENRRRLDDMIKANLCINNDEIAENLKSDMNEPT